MARRKQTHPTKCENEENHKEKSTSPEPPLKKSRVDITPTVSQFDERINQFPLPDPKLMLSYSNGKVVVPPTSLPTPPTPNLTAAQLAQLLLMAKANNWNESVVLKMAGVDVGFKNEQNTNTKKTSRSKIASSPIPVHNGKLLGKLTTSTAMSSSSVTSHSRPSSTSPLGDIVRDAKPSTSNANPLMALEKSMAKFQPAQKGSVPSNPVVSLPSVSQSPTFSGGLGSLFEFVGQLPDRLNSRSGSEDASAILTCLQCGRGYSSMDQLVAHMQQTKHFANLSKPYSTGVTGSNTGTTSSSLSKTQNPTTNGVIVKKEESKSVQSNFDVVVGKLQTAMKTSFVGMKLACARCSAYPEDIDTHLRTSHGVNTINDWIKSVRMVPDGATDRAAISPRTTEDILSTLSYAWSPRNGSSVPPPSSTPHATPPAARSTPPVKATPPSHATHNSVAASLAAYAQMNPFAMMSQLGMGSFPVTSQALSLFPQTTPTLPDVSSSHLNKLMSLINTVQKK